MIVDKVNYDLSHVKFPSLEVAKELTKKYKEPVNNHIIILTATAPLKTAKGVMLSRELKEKLAQRIQQLGVLVVGISSSLEENIQLGDLIEGDFIDVNVVAHDIKSATVVKDEDGQKFEMLIIPFHCVVCIVEPPKFD